MKKWWVPVVAAFLMVMIGACSPASPEVIVENVEVTRLVETEVTRIVEVEVPVEVTRLVEVEVTRVVRPTATPKPSPTATPDAPQIGNRNNPVPMNVTFDAVVTDPNYGEQRLTITVLNVVRGEEAWQVAVAANRYNERPPETHEIILAEVEVTFIEGDGILELGRRDVSLMTNNRVIRYSDMPFVTPCCVEPDFDFQLFPDATGSGWIPLVGPVGDDAPSLLFGDPIDGLYFSLAN